MNRKLILCICFALMIPICLSAVVKKKKVVRRPKVVQPVEDPKFTAMLGSTAQILIFDSVVVDSTDFMSAIFVNKEEGKVTSYQEFFKERGTGMVYVNELGNKCIYSKFDPELGGKYLFQSDFLADGWTIGEPLKGIDNNGKLHDFDFPYLLPDGITLYFSAKSDEGLGGYDIYRTRLDIDGGKYLKPENLGLPFNSDADDYAYVVDEQNRLAYFVSNRRQPNGKTCVYSFVPTDVRKIVNSSNEETLRSLARIDRIADTWKSKKEVSEALQRKARFSDSHSNRLSKKIEYFEFVVNDNTTYKKISDFKTPENQQRMKELLALRHQAEDLNTALLKSRDYYAKASIHERVQLKPEILGSEQQLEKLHGEIHRLEKEIRSSENQ